MPLHVNTAKKQSDQYRPKCHFNTILTAPVLKTTDAMLLKFAELVVCNRNLK